MNTSTIIGLKYGAIAAVVWFTAAFVLINLGLRAEFVLAVLGFVSLPAIGVIVSRAAYAVGKRDRLAVELHDA